MAVCSISMDQRSYVLFVNCSQRQVDVIWLNYEGSTVFYKSLSPQEHYAINTYVTHPWIFRDSNTGDKLVVHMQEVYQPIAYCQQRDGTSRRVVCITIPVYTLKECCLQKIRAVIPTNLIDSLELPNTLIMELKKSPERNDS